MGGHKVTKMYRRRDSPYTGNIYKFQKGRCNIYVCRALIIFRPPGGGGRGGCRVTKINNDRDITCTDDIYINVKGVGAILFSVEHEHNFYPLA